MSVNSLITVIKTSATCISGAAARKLDTFLVKKKKKNCKSRELSKNGGMEWKQLHKEPITGFTGCN